MDIISTAVKQETEIYTDKLITTCKEISDEVISNISKSYVELYDKIESAVKNKIMQTIGTKDLYNYDDIPTINISDLKLNYDCQNYQGHCQCSLNPNHYRKELITCNCYGTQHNTIRKCNYCTIHYAIDIFNKFISGEILIKGEKFVIRKENKFKFRESNNAYCSYDILLYIELITNFGRYIRLFKVRDYIFMHGTSCGGFNDPCGDLKDVFNYPPTSGICAGYQEHNFWIPTDYIHILKSIKGPLNSDFLQIIKNKLYDRKIVPLYTKDVIQENIELNKKYADYELDRKLLDQEKLIFEQEKKKFYEEEKIYIDILKDRKEIKETKEKLKLISKKLKLERNKLEKKKKAFDDIDIDDI